jgi:acetyltransferase-like isoleucine patch superfamily enzyme
MKLRRIIYVLTMFLPWRLRRLALIKLFGYSIHQTAYIGISWICPHELILEEYARIGHFTFCRPIDRLVLGAHAILGSLNWITGFNTKDAHPHFSTDQGRRSELLLGAHSAVTSRHLIDCTASVRLGDFSTFAGYRSQILTHAIDIAASRQTSAPISIGKYCFIGTGSILLKGCSIPDYSVLAAGSVVAAELKESYALYGGVPARLIKSLPATTGYFVRQIGAVE